jgi:predicted Zn-ribbon and HTH transcriptional regulator
MKSKAFILHQIEELLEKNRGLCGEEITQWMNENKEKTVYELLVIKKGLSEKKEYPDISVMKWFRDEDA